MRKRVIKVGSHSPLQMITLNTYAQHIYQYAPPATTEHLRRTVWEPLGLSPDAAKTPPHESLYAVPPITTNIRCTGVNIAGQLQRHLRAAASPTIATTCAVDDGTQECSAVVASPETLLSWRYTPPFTFPSLGLPFCACVQPKVCHLAAWPPSFSASAAAATAKAEVTDPAEVPLVIVVDAGAAEAVLRGSDLYAPGIVTASRVFFAEEKALVAFYAERVPVEDAEVGTRHHIRALQQAKKSKDGAAAELAANVADVQKDGVAASAPPVTCDPARCRIVSALTAGITLPPAQYTPLLVDDDDGAPASSSTVASLTQGSRFLVCIGSGTLLMGWKDVLGRRARGVALHTDWTPQLQPSRAVLRSLLNIASPLSSPTRIAPHVAANDAIPSELRDVFFLQNYSSMVPVSLLVDHLSASVLQRSCTVLDACAAPGGKTSLLISLLQSRVEEEDVKVPTSGRDGGAAPFRVVCCERSRPRQEQMLKLLQSHFANAADHKEGFLSRVLEAHCIDTNKFLKTLLPASPADALCSAFTDTFDAVLLDPPCTGLGLRPKLLPHVHTATSIQQSADYQRKLFDSCVRHLRCSAASPAVLVYSTCTTTMEENEANVVHFLRTYPSLRLARASTPAHHALCALSVTHYPRLQSVGESNRERCGVAPTPQLLLGSEIRSLQEKKEVAAAPDETLSDAPLLALRFMPRPLSEYRDASEDSVGFFVAVFLCYGHDT